MYTYVSQTVSERSCVDERWERCVCMTSHFFKFIQQLPVIVWSYHHHHHERQFGNTIHSNQSHVSTYIHKCKKNMMESEAVSQLFNTSSNTGIHVRLFATRQIFFLHFLQSSSVSCEKKWRHAAYTQVFFRPWANKASRRKLFIIFVNRTNIELSSLTCLFWWFYKRRPTRGSLTFFSSSLSR